jgi:signal transduction histidine kinase
VGVSVVSTLSAAAFVVGALLLWLQRRRLNRREAELTALHEATRDIWDRLDLDHVLQRVVDKARDLLDARYGALSVNDEEGSIVAFITSGISVEERERIGPPPQGRGLLAVPLHQGQTLRLPDLSRHPKAVGFPPGHPAMHSLLAVPIVCQQPFRGNLYLADKDGSRSFDADDEATLLRFAVQAAIAIDNAHVHRTLESLAVEAERQHLAREIHDGVAQVLAYVNAKALAVQEHLERERPSEAKHHLAQLVAATREVYADVREGILGLRTGLGEERTLSEALEDFVRNWEERAEVPADLRIEAVPGLSPVVELQLLRIAQESLSNVRKHAQAPGVRIHLSRREGRVELRVEDDGRGFDPSALGRSQFPRFGLTSMRERAESVGGHLVIASVVGQGTSISVTIPMTTVSTEPRTRG